MFVLKRTLIPMKQNPALYVELEQKKRVLESQKKLNPYSKENKCTANICSKCFYGVGKSKKDFFQNPMISF